MSITYESVPSRGIGHEDYATAVLGPLAKEMRTERRSTTSNDNGIVDGTIPQLSRLAAAYRGKYYPRGCRGLIEEIQIYSMATAGGTVILNLSPHPGLGPVMTVTVTPGVGWAWAAIAVGRSWDYDSLFIWISTISPDVYWVYDEATPYDGHQSTDTGITWVSVDTRPFIRVVYTGESAGDVPVSGIVNNIPIPNTSTVRTAVAVGVGTAAYVELVDVVGAGYVDLINFRVRAAVASHLTLLRIEVDDVIAFDHSISVLWSWLYTPYTQPISLIRYEENGFITLMLTQRWEFKRRLRVLAVGDTAAEIVDLEVYPHLLR